MPARRGGDPRCAANSSPGMCPADRLRGGTAPEAAISASSRVGTCRPFPSGQFTFCQWNAFGMGHFRGRFRISQQYRRISSFCDQIPGRIRGGALPIRGTPARIALVRPGPAPSQRGHIRRAGRSGRIPGRISSARTKKPPGGTPRRSSGRCPAQSRQVARGARPSCSAASPASTSPASPRPPSAVTPIRIAKAISQEAPMKSATIAAIQAGSVTAIANEWPMCPACVSPPVSCASKDTETVAGMRRPHGAFRPHRVRSAIFGGPRSPLVIL